MAHEQPNIGAPLLQFLQTAFEDYSLRYTSPPTPLIGGYSSYLYKFQVNSTGPLANPLVIRLCPSGTFPPGQAFIEGEIQNLLAAEGYPTAPVYSICEDPTTLGHEFLIMRFMPGERMLTAYPYDQVSTALAHAHVQLHALDMDAIMHKLRRKGFYTRAQLGIFTSTYELFLDRVKAQIAARKLMYLMPALDWIQQHRGVIGRNLGVSHCDFHPMNLLIDHGTVSAVLDWQGWRIGEPEFDVTNTMIKLHCLAAVHMPHYDWSGLIKPYVEQYHHLSPLNTEKLRYYQAVWCIRIFMMILDMPRVDHQQVRHRLLDHFQAITGIEIQEN
jgi:aminoglycoside phosphotransferase (APT) family kinase protein